MPVIVQEPDATFAPVRAAIHEREFLAEQGVKRMSDPEGLTWFAEITCN